MPTKTPAKRKAKAPQRSRSAKLPAGNDGLRIRMYRQGLGDCFLLTFPTDGPRPFYMLIDCGVVLGTSDPGDKMTRVLNDIIRETEGVVDLLVATHEHWDHISGFTQVKDLFFEKLEFRRVWLAWTENPKDALANRLRAERRVAEEALRVAAFHLALNESEGAGRVRSLVDFFGARSGSTTDALDNVVKLAKGKPRYCSPGEPPIEIEGIPGVRFWIMGPPKDEKLLKKSNPGKNDAYGLDAGPVGAQALLISALTRDLGMGAAQLAGPEDSLEDPFDGQYCIPVARARQASFFAARYFGESADDSIVDSAAGEGEGQSVRDQSWRRIDDAWLGGAETMALQLDSATNNTSLVLAIELTDSGKILLFPGDAQAGNWLSWQKLRWQLEDPVTNSRRVVTGPDLLSRTVFYKVSHHGSHNATLKAMGLEQMASDELVAMIPVDHEMARKKGWGRIPLPDLVERLKEKTLGRILRIDDATEKVEDLVALKPDSTDDPTWKAFTNRVKVTADFYELSF